LLNKAYFFDVASSYIEKMQRRVAENDGFEGRITILNILLI